jgi:hypothetical protein
VGVIGGAATAAGVALFGFAKSAANAADQVRDASLRTGQSAKDFQRLNFAFEQSGGGAQGLERALSAINDAIGDVQSGKVTDTTRAFQSLGVRLVDGARNARPALDIFKDLADRLSNIQSPADRAAKLVQLFGRRVGPQLNELLGQGSKGITALIKDFDKLGAGLSTKQLTIGDELNDSLGRLGTVAKGTKTQLGLLFAPALTEAAGRITEAMAKSRGEFLKLGEAVAARVAPVIRDVTSLIVGEPQKIQSSFIAAADKTFRALGTVVTGLQQIFQGWLVILERVGQVINAIFGTQLTGGDVAAFLIVTKLVGGFQLLLTAGRAVAAAFGLLGTVFTALGGPLGLIIRGVALVAAAIGGLPLILAIAAAAIVAFFAVWAFNNWDKIRKFASDTWNAIVKGVTDLWRGVQKLFGDGVNAVNAFWKKLGDGATAIWNAIVEGAKGLWDGMAKLWESGVDKVLGTLRKLRDTAVAVWNAITEAANKAFGAQSKASGTGGAATPAVAAAGGGRISGPGTGTSDSILAWLSDGEFVVRAAAVRKYGSNLFAALNSLQLPKGALQGFNLGGLVDAMSVSLATPRYALASGGPIEPAKSQRLHNINLTIDRETISGLLAPDDVADKIFRYTTKRQMNRAGRRPSWVG